MSVAPLLLQLLELVVRLVGLLGRGRHHFYLVYDGLLLLQVVLFLGLQFTESLGALLADNAHLGLEGLFQLVGHHGVLVRVAPGSQVSLLLGIALSEVQLVEHGLQMVYLVLSRGLVAMCYLPHPVQHGLLGGIGALLLGLLGPGGRSLGGSLGGHGLGLLLGGSLGRKVCYVGSSCCHVVI